MKKLKVLSIILMCIIVTAAGTMAISADDTVQRDSNRKN